MTLSKKSPIHYELAGPDDAPVLVLSHALGTDLTLWDQQVEVLRGSFRIIRFDTRGHGKSAAPREPYTLSLLAFDIVTLLDELGVSRVHFCGVSMGGLIGQYLAVHHPERIASLVLSNTAAKIGNSEKWDRRIELVAEAGMSAVFEEVLNGWFSAPFRDLHPPIVDSLAGVLKATAPEGYIGCCQALRDADLRQHLERVKSPTLVIAGTEDQAIPMASAQFLQEKIPDSQLIQLRCAHLACAEAAAEFTDELNRFLRKQSNQYE
jgi:3-oxoadipate enol-lactonase